MRHARSLLLFGAVIAGCQFSPAAARDDGGGPGRDGRRMRDAPPPPLDLGPCAGSGASCNGSTLVSCSGKGAMPTTLACAWGCLPGAMPSCGVLHPAGGAVTSTDLPTTGLPDVQLSGLLSTDNDPRVFVRDDVAILRAGSIEVVGDLQVTGGHALALVASGTIKIDAGATVHVNGQGTTPGPGPHPQGAGASQTSDDHGGGGGGYGSAGGDGGNTIATGGPPFGDAGILMLVGGGDGGHGGGAGAGAGGGGGGAIQLVSAATLELDGAIDAGGGGGQNGVMGHGAGGGGGAGGTILLEAPTIDLEGALAANGGGGGGGTASAGFGQDGQLGTTPASGGTGGANGGGGGAGGMPAGGAGGGGSKGGGGGGGVGRIRINTLVPPAVPGSGATISPPPVQGTVDVRPS